MLGLAAASSVCRFTRPPSHSPCASAWWAPSRCAASASFSRLAYWHVSRRQVQPGSLRPSACLVGVFSCEAIPGLDQLGLGGPAVHPTGRPPSPPADEYEDGRTTIARPCQTARVHGGSHAAFDRRSLARHPLQPAPRHDSGVLTNGSGRHPATNLRKTTGRHAGSIRRRLSRPNTGHCAS